MPELVLRAVPGCPNRRPAPKMLWVAALGVGIGVDCGIYIFARLNGLLGCGMTLEEAFFQTLQVSGNAVLMTGLTLTVGVATWILSALQFQADMGLLVAFMFLTNMNGAIVLLPALACVFMPRRSVGGDRIIPT